MILTDKCKKDFNDWLSNYKNLNNYNIDIFINTLIEEWMNTMNIFLIPTPILGSKNGYDSYPIIGWRCDILETNKNTTNSYYMGYPIMYWHIHESLELGETFSDINITVSENLKNAKHETIKNFNIYYNCKKTL